MRSFVITAAIETLQKDDDLEVFRGLIQVSDHALVTVTETGGDGYDNMFATVVVIEPVILDDEGHPHSLEELEQVKQAELARRAEEATAPRKPRRKGGKNAQLTLAPDPEVDDDE